MTVPPFPSLCNRSIFRPGRIVYSRANLIILGTGFS
jgi:hypothetical protein